MKARYRKPENFRKIALERIRTLFGQAGAVFGENPKLANRYVFLARRISMRYKTRMPADLKRRFCRHCHSFLVPSSNARVRLQNQKVVYYCLNCKKHMRFPYVREKKQERKR